MSLDSQIVMNLNYFISILSIVSTIWLIHLCRRARPRTIAIKLIALLSLSDLFFSVSNLMPALDYTKENTLCKVEGHIKIFFFTYSIFIAAFIAVYHAKLANINKPFNKNVFMLRSAVFSFALSLALTLGTLYSDKIIVSKESYEGFCYMKHTAPTDEGYKLFYILFVLLPTGLGITVSLICYLVTVKRVKKASNILLGQSNTEVSVLFWFPAVMFLTLLPYMTTNLASYLFSLEIPAGAVYLETLITHSIGLTNAITYGVQRKLYARRLSKGNMGASVSEHLEKRSQDHHELSSAYEM